MLIIYVARFSRPMTLGTRAHQMALYVIYEAPLQMLADAPSNYYENRESAEFISKIPTIWEKTTILKAKIADYLVLARKSGNNWYLAGITDEDARSFSVDLSFLDKGSTYELEWVEDGVNSDRIARDYKQGKKNITAEDQLDIKMNSRRRLDWDSKEKIVIYYKTSIFCLYCVGVISFSSLNLRLKLAIF